jgi:phage replication O-like protein O
LANPKIEDGFTKVPNSLLDKLCEHKIAGRQVKILMVVIRKTLGWHNDWARISQNEFARMTRIPRRNCFDLLKELIDKKIIKKGIPKNGDTKAVNYCVNLNYSEWKVSLKKRISSKKGTEVSLKKGIEVSPKTGTHKRKIKERKEIYICQKDEILKRWNEFADKHRLSLITGIKSGSQREKHLFCRLDESMDFKLLLQKVERQPYLLGEGKDEWGVSFDWILKPSNYQKVMEEQYKKRTSSIESWAEARKKKKEETPF